MVSALRREYQQGNLKWIAPGKVDSDLDTLMQKDWVVYTKACDSTAKS